jgi:acyl-CoA synthetase (NDP forming)
VSRPLAPLLEPRSVAVVGASARPGSFGNRLLAQLLEGGYRGEVHPVNPRYREVLGLPCHPSLAEAPGPLDLAVLAVPNAALEAQLAAAADHGVPAAVIFASCQDPAPPALAERLRRIALDARMAVCGGNGMGFFNLEHSLRVCGYPEPPGLACGPVAVVTHSGSVFSALLHNDRGLGFNLVVSAGMELVTTAAAYLDHALELAGTRVVALFLETVREPAALGAALAKAAAREVPVVALKVGRGPAAGAMVAAHSGALAGADGAYQALFDAYGVARVHSLDELVDTCELLAAGRRAFPGGLAAIHDSGGERAHLMDLAEELEVPLARISEATRARLASVLEPGLPASNPLDAWGTGNDADEIFAACARALLDDPDTGALALALDLTTEPTPDTSWTGLAVRTAAATGKPVVVLGNLASGVDPADAARLRAAGIPVLEGTATGLAALRHLLAWRDFLAHPSAAAAAPPVAAAPEVAPGAAAPAAPAGASRAAGAAAPGGPTAAVRARWRERLADPRPLGEVEALAMLADWGVPVVAAEEAASLEAALAAAGRVGWPVALKTAAPGVHHKTAAGGVRLGLAGPEELAATSTELAGRLGPRVVVARMAEGGVELALGLVRDPQFGPLVMVAAGGVLVEVLRDRRFLLPPVDARTARAALDRLAVRPLLHGFGPTARPADLDAVADAVVALSGLAVDLGDRLAAVDVNPLLAGPDGCVAVDALVVRAPA